MRIFLSLLYLFVAGAGILLVYMLRLPTEHRAAAFVSLMVVWIGTLPLSILAVLISPLVSFGYDHPAFLAFFAVCSVVNVVWVNYGKVRNER